MYTSRVDLTNYYKFAKINKSITFITNFDNLLQKTND